MRASVASRRFDPAFDGLHPSLQDLHRSGGTLRGPVAIHFGAGLAGFAGRRIARRLGIPCETGEHTLEVAISHDDVALHGDRCFDDGACFASTFRPYGHWPTGGWTESTALVALKLQADVIDGGWYWRCTGAQLGRLPVPRWLLPRGEAYKRIENARYRFSVSFALPLLGEIVRYGGLLDALAAPVPIER